MGYLNTEIERCRTSLKRRQAKLDDMAYQARNACCPRCFWGEPWRLLQDKQNRARAWLLVLLRKRATPDDVSFARAVEIHAWP